MRLRLIQTKFFRPQAGADLVRRPRLLARLDEGLDRDLILVSAPPGSGKTTLASQWLASCGRASAWLSLDERDNDLAHLTSYVCAAVRSAFPETCTDLQALLESANLPGKDALSDLLLDELSALPDDLILVLDDYHHIRAPEVHGVLRQLLRYRPPCLHLVLLTRSDPPLSLGRMRLTQRITEVRGADLRFALDETRRLLQERTGQPLDDKLIHALQARTEGWAIGLQLAGLSMQSQSPDQLLAHFGGSHGLLAGYMIEEVMEGLPEAVTAFLTRTALLDRFCTPLGDALLAGGPWADSSQAAIDHLLAQNLFVVPLDDQGTWFRYHDLFRDFLTHRLETGQDRAGVSELHRRAGDWLAQAGQIGDALRHLLAAGEETHAADLVEANLQPLLNTRVPAPVLARWLGHFEESFIQEHPGLLIARAYLLAFRWDGASIPAVLDRAEMLVRADSGAQGASTADGARTAQPRLAVLDGLRGYVARSRGDPRRAISLLQRAMEGLDPVACSYTYAQSLKYLAMAYDDCGEREKALDLLRSALAEATVFDRPERFIFLGACAQIHLDAGELAELTDITEQILSLAGAPAAAEASAVSLWRGWAHLWLGTARYEQNDLESAALHWRQIEASRYWVHPGAYIESLVGLAHIAQAQGDAVQALAYAQAAREYALEQHGASFLRRAEALAACLALAAGENREALRCVEAFGLSADPESTGQLEHSCLEVGLRALLAEDTPASLATARRLAESCLHQAEPAHNPRQVVWAASLLALVLRAQRRTPEAFAVLDRALALAEPRGYVRTFLDLGAPMAELLQQNTHQRSSSPYVQRLLAAFARELDLAEQHDLAAQTIQLYGITPLTQRELELLNLLAQRLTYHEIAERLVISPNTVKKHAGNIYGKLGVRNRRQAIAKAQEVGLLSPA